MQSVDTPDWEGLVLQGCESNDRLVKLKSLLYLRRLASLKAVSPKAVVAVVSRMCNRLPFTVSVLVFTLFLLSLYPKAEHRLVGSSVSDSAAMDVGCLQAPRCSGSVYRVRVLDLVRDGNRYDRRLVSVSGEPIMVKRRRGACGPYNYFVLKDTEGFFVPVTDYTAADELVEQRRVVVRGFYRAEMHLIDVCQEVR